MGRPQTLNPLAVAFGGALRLHRLRLDLTTNEAAHAAGLSPTFLRLIESGRNHIAVGKGIDLHTAFGKKLKYEAIVFFLSTIASLEDAAAQLSDPVERGKRLSEQAVSIGLALGHDHAFQAFLRKFCSPLSMFPSETPKVLQETSNVFDAVILPPHELRTLITRAGLEREAMELLASYDDYSAGDLQIDEAYPVRFFKDIPTLYKDLFDGLRSSILGFPPVFVPEASWEWERRNHSIFEELFVVCNWQQLVSFENLKRYRFDYLWEKAFKRAVFILLDSPCAKNPQDLKTEFWDNLQIALESKLQDECSEITEKHKVRDQLLSFRNSKDNLKDKTIFCPCPSNKIEEVNELLSSKRGPAEHPLNAIWFFRTTDKAYVGAASHIDPVTVKATHILFLTFSECSHALQTFKEIFPELL